MENFKSENYYDLALYLTKELCSIPAPSHHEEKRAEYILNYLKGIGYDNAYIDEAKNVIWDIKGNTDKYALIIAHTDTVFPDTTPMPIVEDETYLYCPGVGDDTVCVAIILAVCKYLKDVNYKPTTSLLFSANACEEGLGNLKGVKQIFKDYSGKIDHMFSIDCGGFSHIYNKSVGSHRYKVAVTTKGGHSYGAFGNPNAINELSKIVTQIYEIQVPKKEGTKTTYNVGIFEGGTSVNTICQKAEMLCEYRSDDLDCLNIMKNNFETIFETAKNNGVDIQVELIGNRPCMGNVDEQKMQALSKRAMDIQQKYSDKPVIGCSASTDCNIPHSLGIPAVCIAGYVGKGAHTREERIEKESIKTGLNVLVDIIKSEEI